MKDIKIAQIIVDNKCKETDRVYSYLIPDDMNLSIGHRVIVPFGRSNKKVEGYVVGITDSIDFEINKLKSIISLTSNEVFLSPNMLKLIAWIREKYLCYYIEAIHGALPANIRIKNTYRYELNNSNKGIDLLKEGYPEILTEIVEFIVENGDSATKEELRDSFNDNLLENALKKLIKLGILRKRQIIKKQESIKYDKFVYPNNTHNMIISAAAKKQKLLMDLVCKNPGINIEVLKKDYSIGQETINTMLKKGYIKVEEREAYRLTQEELPLEEKKVLTVEQQRAVKEIKNYFDEGNHVLLNGVTGSGKTEIYLQLIETELEKGKQGIVLVPEISLTPQMIRRFISRFGNTVAVLHSGLSSGEKYDEWRRIAEGKAKVAIGARSAIFAPFNNLGIIIIDEEHESTYKSETRPKYDAREVAMKRSEIEGANLLFGSATPSIESYYKAVNNLNRMKLVSIDSRVNNKKMPDIEIIDMREELKSGNKSIFSNRLTEEINNALNSGNQLILFLNRRGYSTFVSCRSCGYVAKCPNCNISLTYHAKGDYLSCHYCGYSKANPKVCPSCKSKYIKYFGIGTQRVEKEFEGAFGKIKILRMDADTTTKKNSHKIILDKFRNKEAQVLIGTQMIGKGHDFPDVTLVGIITSDTYLNLPDFRAGERTFQMVTQSAGRAGRGDKPGVVIIQSYSPHHYSLIHARKHDYVGFFKDEIRLRKEMNYPPFSHLGQIVISGYKEDKVIRAAREVGDLINSLRSDKKDIEIWGPSPAPLSRINNRHRWQLVLKADKENKLLELIKDFYSSNTLNLSEIGISVDINPLSML
ncbi:MAG: primosomal protein N' [Lutispora sp.]|jgi:primosomal protein N' (replication factor Y)